MGKDMPMVLAQKIVDRTKKIIIYFKLQNLQVNVRGVETSRSNDKHGIGQSFIA